MKKPIKPLRTKFCNEVVTEFFVPSKPSNKVIIFCDGMPSIPCKRDLLEFFSKRNYWVFHPRYRGSWESGGRFLQYSPEKDIIAIIDELPRGFQSLWDRKHYRVVPQEIYLLGNSFGGTAAILASQDPRVTKVVVLSPVVDWRVPSKTQPLDAMWHFIHEAYQGAYRVKRKDWEKLKTGTFYNPIYKADSLLGEKICIVHAKDDTVIAWRSVEKFAHATKSTLLLLNQGGHISSKSFLDPQFYRKIKAFLKK